MLWLSKDKTKKELREMMALLEQKTARDFVEQFDDPANIKKMARKATRMYGE